MRIANPTRTQAILKKHGFTFKKSFGQNFLQDSNVLAKIVATAKLDKTVNVIEIGPGIGALTEFLAEAAAEVKAFEIDRRLIPILADTLSDFDNIEIINQDILKADLKAVIQTFSNPKLPLKVVANLPYYITTPIIMSLLETDIPIAEFVVMMQKEVADRISAKPSTKNYGSLSIAAQYYTEAKVAFIVPRTVFVPQPNVDSAILQLIRLNQPRAQVQDEKFFFECTRAAFVHRRKTLWNNYVSHFGKTVEAKAWLEAGFQKAALAQNRRGESLSIEEFANLANQLFETKSTFNELNN
ncbi:MULTISPECIES: 16S rRNA (adenine(1518)-N(6)/adenine(1519)-N(6))-dimethyltransferase RsmA [unclassified Enterococcus]|uniref:16S rRNA (adenine(1518)-N(6)/adenine(1519)-N(6))- dimethyltransferase RsmA n=1 Tax=unclassified Enterococcus TaxID=2608891 RepID=UPI0015582E5C|nr:MULTISPECIES: 16S rRNA (adenine(1518)-N(6)/adenine(1519)-N(6))-dimethyltransferase RsmA [unclassified Enterococcus]MBS7576284.1 16S rRNA (adenine(1518)-N(6)/adenine(1519)-N(6))-dimethyltransferase RsmA [Enterococcus sp. MMGLQ5-2]MBS7583517.1 16S rRNA (adenine(1518)-N(6)/adenine(1519)-N(6))-dimethyltransferase RsmA [Enterococcus sp. MMGLQ5-1]NPD11379.1 16S rRNA (adenine(1518)-N(6)/adenine(1519)-N(6))-dimethyltransferase RsmA [Enterococcus sp. MMGLQ5-1]NPD36122.1 16S rRNA (adenine(1518)-N(6)/a